MKWNKIGFLYNCVELHPKLKSHAANPLPIHIKGDTYRVFFSARDSDNRSSVGAVDLDIIKREVIQEFRQPFITHGDQHSFYSHGISIGNAYEVDGITYMLFMGWQNKEGEHWYGEIGRLIVHQDLTLSLDSDTPFLPLDDVDPISLSYPWVMYDKGIYKMWYGSTESWDSPNGEMIHVIKYAESTDGHTWQKKGSVVPYEIGVAQAFSRPSVFVDNAGKYHMWFSFRSGSGESYRIGYAFSDDGLKWLRTNESVIDLSNSGWDSQMIEYPFIMQHERQFLMLYNGNAYGLTGFGLAVNLVKKNYL